MLSREFWTVENVLQKGCIALMTMFRKSILSAQFQSRCLYSLYSRVYDTRWTKQRIRALYEFIIFQYCFIFRPTDSTVSEDANNESKTVETSAMAVRRCNHSARSYPHMKHTKYDTNKSFKRQSTNQTVFPYLYTSPTTRKLSRPIRMREDWWAEVWARSI